MTEKAEKYRAISEVAALLRESTIKERTPVEYDPEEHGFSIGFEYVNTIFTPEQHESVKRAFLKLCGEI